ncbi:MAG: TlpA family protein disulfide reductase [Anaerolineales bacterium]|nr:TlpA family protein disulfide reductase [Anaerolineales bacterium]
MVRNKVVRKRRPANRKKNHPLSLILIGAGLLFVGVVALPVLIPRGESSSDRPEVINSVLPVEVNYPAPELKATDLLEQPVSLSDYKGHVLLLNNWATWCPPCKAEMPTLRSYYDDHKADGFVLIGINAGEESDQVAMFASSLNLTFPVWVDLEEASLRAFRTTSLPSSFVIDRSGQVRLAWTGAIDRDALEEHVTPIILE